MKLIVNGEVAQIPTGGGGVVSSIPTGGIIIWSGAADAVPDGWHLCDGTEGTPDLRGRFVLGVSEAHTIGETGGEENVTLTIDTMPVHSHYQNISDGTKSYSWMQASGSMTTLKNTSLSMRNGNGVHVETDRVGGDEPHNNMPPYYALAYIMKL